MKIKYSGILLLVAGAVVTNYANAASCTTGPSSSLSTTDLKIGSSEANDCAGIYAGNDTGNGGTALTNLNNGLFDTAPYNDGDSSIQWGILTKSDSAAQTYLTIKFTLTAANTPDGGWTLAWEDTDTGTPLNYTFQLDLAFSLKASTSYALYYFDDVNFGSNGNTSGTYHVSWKGNENAGANAGLSHLSLFARAASSDLPPPPQEIPEPSLLALLGVGLLGFGLKRKQVNA